MLDVGRNGELEVALNVVVRIMGLLYMSYRKAIPSAGMKPAL